MDIKYGKQIDIGLIENLNIDLFLFGANHEERVFTIYNRIKSSNNIKDVVGFKYNDNLPFQSSKEIEYFRIIEYSQVSKILDDFFKKLNSSLTEINIVVDYSCMTKPWYYTVILYLSKKKLELNRIKVYFSYTPSKYADPLSPKPNKDIVPLPGKYMVPTDRPKALIVCLGYEKNKAEGIIEHLDPKECYIFYSKPALDDNFVKRLEENNKDIIELYKNNVITFPLNNLINLERELTSLYYLLKDKYSIIIAPLGPKPFTFISMLLSVKYKNIDIWRVGSGQNINEYKRQPINSETFIISEVEFVK